MEHTSFLTKLVNSIIRSIMDLMGMDIEKGKEIVSNHVVMACIVTILLILIFKLTAKNLSLFPGKMQVVLESLYKVFRSLVDDVIGPEGRKFIPAIATLGIFIATCNFIGLLPDLSSPTANLNVTAGCAVFVFLYYHYQGVKKHGLWGYIKTFMGPEWWLSWLFLPIEVVSHISRLLSLSMRLFGNIYGEDLVIIIVLSISPWYLSFSPLPMMAFAIFTSILQAYIFIMLSTMYLAGAMASEH